MYEDFAEIYDTLMDNVDYESWADYYVRLLSLYGINKGKLCECACGTGSLTLPLHRRGYQMTGVDISREMLWQAAQKARKQGIAMPFVQQDMRALNLHRPMDAILATCDGVNYLLKDEDALSFFGCAYRALNPGGLLLFDVSSPYKLREVLCRSIICEDRENITYMWENKWNEKTETVDMRLIFFVKDGKEQYRRIDEQQKQRAWGPERLVELLERSGFEQVNFFGDGTMYQPTAKELRWHVAAVKPYRQED